MGQVHKGRSYKEGCIAEARRLERQGLSRKKLGCRELESRPPTREKEERVAEHTESTESSHLFSMSARVSVLEGRDGR